MFSSEHGPDIEKVSNASEFLGDALNILNNDTALVYCVWRRPVASRCLHYGVNEFLWVLIKHRIMSYVLNFFVEIFLNLTYDLRSTVQAMIDFPFHTTWAVGLELTIMTCISKFPVNFRGQFRTSLHDQDVRERKSVINLLNPGNILIDPWRSRCRGRV
jgi:hypothetical protein